jgi:hypothetical protein
MARMTCSCGELLSNSTVPNDVELFVYTGEEWDEILKFDTIETWKIPAPKYEVWKCPKCKKILSVMPDGRAVCEQGHSYDRAREGYYNLLLRNVGGVHGDNREMVLARRAFLDTGAYLPLAKALYSAVKSSVVNLEGAAVLDAGCGEGYYTDYVERRLSEDGIFASVSGFDISRDAIRYAAKKNTALQLAVAGAYDMPISDASADVVLNLFAPLALVRRGHYCARSKQKPLEISSL